MTTMRMALTGLIVAFLAAPAAATAETITSTPITAAFSHNVLGAGSGGTFGVKVHTNPGDTLFPPPSNHAVVHLTKGLKIDTKPFEKKTCSKAQIDARGANTCPREAIVGGGSSQIGAVLGSQIVHERAKVTAFAGPRENGHPVLNVYADARSPVSAQIVLHGVLLKDTSDPSKYGMKVDVDVPPIPTAPGSPDASILSFDVKLDGKIKVRKGKKTVTKYLAYLPKKCPVGGFPWKGDFSFVDGQTSSGTTTSPCPKK